LQKGVELVANINAYHEFFTYYLRLLWDVLTTLWYCYRGGGECCYPTALKEQYAEALKREDIESKLPPPSSYVERAKGALSGTAYRAGNVLKTWGRQLFSFSDPRVKRELMQTNLVLNGLRIRMYVLRPDFLHQLELQNESTLPKWIREVQSNTEFWKRQTFFSVDADEVEEKFPEAVHSYCFKKKPKRNSTVPLCTKYILYSKLPKKLRDTLAHMNEELYTSRIPRMDKKKSFERQRRAIVYTHE
jgi:hypothetical protein